MFLKSFFMSTALFHESLSSLQCIKVQCSMNERRSYEERSVFFVHPFFNGETEWPLKTHVVCRYDGEPFETIPIPLPIGFDDDRNIYTCYGIFCSAACVKAFMENNPVYSNALSMIWLKKIMCEVFGDFDDVVEAPPIELLTKHGGNLNIEEFRKFGKQKTRILTHRPPFFTCALAFELVKEHGKKKEKTTEKEPQSEVETTPSLKNVKKLQRQSNRKTTVVQKTDKKKISSLTETEEASNECINASDELLTHQEQSLLPDTIIQVPANIGNRWEIRGLRRPTQSSSEDKSMNPAPTRVLQQQQQQQQQQQPPSKSLFQDYLEQRVQKKEPQKQQESVEMKPQRRRGRPKSSTKPDSPKNPAHGTLVSFLKT